MRWSRYTSVRGVKVCLHPPLVKISSGTGHGLSCSSTPHERRHGPAGYSDYKSYKPWLRDKVVTHAKYVVFQRAEVAVPRQLFAAIPGRIGRLRLACAAG